MVSLGWVDAKTAVLAPKPSARVATTAAAKPGSRRSRRTLCRRSRQSASKIVAPASLEMTISDGATLKLTASAKYQVSDPHKAVNTVAGHEGAIYPHLQLALRQIVAGETDRFEFVPADRDRVRLAC